VAPCTADIGSSNFKLGPDRFMNARSPVAPQACDNAVDLAEVREEIESRVQRQSGRARVQSGIRRRAPDLSFELDPDDLAVHR
jgi:hypothetical protein